MLRLIGTKERYHSTLLQARPDKKKMGRVKACFGGVGGKSQQPLFASMKIQITQKTAIWVEASLWRVQQRTPFFVCLFVCLL